MADTRYDVVGIGNAIVDIIGRCDDAFLTKHDLRKGFMRLVDAREAEHLYALLEGRARALGRIGRQHDRGARLVRRAAAFIGRVADDKLGQVFARDIRTIGVAYDTAPATSGAPTALCIIFVTPDGERTMNTFLGASTELGPQRGR